MPEPCGGGSGCEARSAWEPALLIELATARTPMTWPNPAGPKAMFWFCAETLL